MLQIDIAYTILKITKTFIITILTYYSTGKIMNKTQQSANNKPIIIILNVIISIIYYFLRERIGTLIATIALVTLLGMIIVKTTNKNLGHSILCTSISLAINNILFVIASGIIYIPIRMLEVKNDYIIITLMSFVYAILVYLFFKIKKIKNGFDFLNASVDSEYFEMLFFNISAIILFCIALIINYNKNTAESVGTGFMLTSIILFITIQKSFKQYYKQKLLIQELDKTKEELAKKTKEVEDLEAENINISKKAHTLSHKQKSLAHKIDEMMMKAEISTEQAAEVRDRLNEIGKDLFKEKIATELSKTGIKEIDDMLNYMQSECKENKIDFELQLKGNIHHMTNNLISKQDLETLLADHIRNAIIAINHTDNINRSILVKLGKIDETYGLYIYDSGVEFKKETLENLGKKPSTTHAEEGGTGMGFMNTFDTLRKCNASLTIEEFNKPCQDNYTKAIMIKFDNKNEFKIKSYATL